MKCCCASIDTIHTPVLLGCADWHTAPAPCTCPFIVIGSTLVCVEIPPRDPWLTLDRLQSVECARPQEDRFTAAARSLPHHRRQLLPSTGGRRPPSPLTDSSEESDNMPRSFLVKTHQSSKKPNCGGLRTQTEGKSLYWPQHRVLH